MNWCFSFSIFIMLLVGWVVTHPLDALNLIGGIRRQFRQSVIEHYGNMEAKKLAQQLKQEARKQDIPIEIAKEILQEHREEIIQRLGNHIVND